MGELFLKTLNMSIAASWLILAVVLLRFALKKAPKWIAVLLWGIVALRLAVPFSFESALSLIPSAETFNAHNIQYETPVISSGIPAVNNAVNPILDETFAPNPAGSVNPLYVWIFIVSVIWLIGIAAMLLYAVISYVRVRRSVAERAPYEENIFLCDQVKSPFILGLVRPKIYLPSNMDVMAMEPVIAHEKAHLARRDHWWKPMGFLILAVH
jgi:beta-lactamase regulating signal transducer with metallopeptidase domain